MGVAQHDGAQAHAVLEELVAVDVPDAAAAPALDERRHALRVLVIALGVGMRSPRHASVQKLT